MVRTDLAERGDPPAVGVVGAGSTAPARAALPPRTSGRDFFEDIEDPMPEPERRWVRAAIGAVVVAILIAKTFTVWRHAEDGFWNLYGILVTTLILSRFVLARRYRPPVPSRTYEPTVTIVVPAMNEEGAIGRTLRRCLAVDYPAEKLQVIAVDDGSTDGTLEAMREIRCMDRRLDVVALGRNQGKRQAMAAGIGRAFGEVLVFIDSDSFVERDGIRKIASYFAHPDVGAVCGHTDVYNKDANVLTKMQAVRYYLAFRVCKSAEARFGAVMCCSGCFSAYRKSAVLPILPAWTTQRFMGAPSTFGDDRSLTNFLLGSWRIVYAPDARATTIVPDRFRVFMRQQLRWKKSWTRELFRAARQVVRKNPTASLSFFATCVLLGLMPFAVIRSLFIQPAITGRFPSWYMSGLLLIPALYGLYYRMYRRDSAWIYGVLYCFLWATVLVWQMPYALATIRDSRWGTRTAA